MLNEYKLNKKVTNRKEAQRHILKKNDISQNKNIRCEKLQDRKGLGWDSPKRDF